MPCGTDPSPAEPRRGVLPTKAAGSVRGSASSLTQPGLSMRIYAVPSQSQGPGSLFEFSRSL